jgi:putative ABC transport system substrate-binding protein
VRSGIAENLSRPGGNVTGVTTDAGIEIYGRQLQILREAAPAAGRVACLASGTTWDGPIGQVLRAAASRLGITLIAMSPPEIGAAQIRDRFAAMAEQRVDAAIVSSEGDFLAHRALIVDLARSHRVPAMYPYRDYVELGGLMAYAPDLGELARRLAEAVRQILAGTRAGDIPFYQPTTIQLLVNLGAARAIGLTLPPALLARADEVIE